ncbi:flagellar hook-associated protein FlgL [Comamonas thiooxydans]|uniref:flagellar hook-associated protein FlgL n=1 Tax=Comamonas thiooxydans TaxID=363952 RepID=UPI00242CC346|nr:flagellar hook-associated protein FlgL [Comamonas thiooxydans]MDH1253828.1 flagellar hook-associated protein FlgL [Comamonas thiooxydans]
MSNITRVGTASMYESSVRNINSRQSNLVELMDKITAGKRVLRASDDPVAAAQAERARTRLTRTESDQRALDAQRNLITHGESTLGEANTALQDFRDLLVNAGNGSFNQTSRDALVAQMTSLRDQLMTYANRKDSNGLPLFRGLDSSEKPVQGYNFAGQAGQSGSGDNSIPNALDGAAAWMNVPTGNGVLAVEVGEANKGKAWANVGVISDPAAATALTAPVSIEFSMDADGKPQYSLDGGATFAPYKSGEAIEVAGMKLTITGDPAAGDTFTVKPSERSDIFSVLDKAIDAVRNGSNADGSTASGALSHAIAKGLAEIDTGMSRMQTVRSFAGDLLNRADRIEYGLSAQSVQQEADRSRAEDLDMIPALSEKETQNVGLQAALQSYAQIQKLSLFNYIG